MIVTWPPRPALGFVWTGFQEVVRIRIRSISLNRGNAMRLPKVRFTIRRLMVTIAVIALALGAVTQYWDALAALSIIVFYALYLLLVLAPLIALIVSLWAGIKWGMSDPPQSK